MLIYFYFKIKEFIFLSFHFFIFVKTVNLREKHLNLVKSYEDESNILLSGDLISGKSFLFLFQCKDERIPFDFMKKV